MESEKKISQSEFEKLCQKVLKDYDVENNPDVTDIEIWHSIREYLYQEVDEPIPYSQREASEIHNYVEHVKGIIDRRGDGLQGEIAIRIAIHLINKAKGRTEPNY